MLTAASTIGPFLAALFFYFSFVINSFRWYPPRGDYNTNQLHKVRTGGGRTKSFRPYLLIRHFHPRLQQQVRFVRYKFEPFVWAWVTRAWHSTGLFFPTGACSWTVVVVVCRLSAAMRIDLVLLWRAHDLVLHLVPFCKRANAFGTRRFPFRVCLVVCFLIRCPRSFWGLIISIGKWARSFVCPTQLRLYPAQRSKRRSWKLSSI